MNAATAAAAAAAAAAAELSLTRFCIEMPDSTLCGYPFAADKPYKGLHAVHVLYVKILHAPWKHHWCTT